MNEPKLPADPGAVVRRVRTRVLKAIADESAALRGAPPGPHSLL